MTTLVTVSLTEENGQQSISYQNGDPNTPLQAATIEQLIRALGVMRAQMSPPVRTEDPKFGDEVEALTDPRWWINADSFIGGALLQIRHPGFGWLGFALPLQSLRDLHALSGNALQTVEAEAKKSPN